MAVRLTVRAEVVDLTKHQPAANESYLVDTNVWWWSAYAFAPELPVEKKPRSYQLTAYPDFLKRAKIAGADLLWSPLTWPELTHHIERTEFEMARYYGAPNTENAKAYRHNDPDERARVVQVIADAWAEVEALGSSMGDLTITSQLLSKAAVLQAEAGLDGYDLLMALTLQKSGLTGIVSDDGDFCTVPSIRVFTSNQNVLRAAGLLT